MISLKYCYKNNFLSFFVVFLLLFSPSLPANDGVNSGKNNNSIETTLTLPTIVPSTLSRLYDIIYGKVAKVASIAPSRLPSLFSHAPEKTLFSLSFLKAKSIFWNTYNRVPAYKDFVDKNTAGIFPRTFNDIPITDKSNYIKAYPLRDTLINGEIPLQGQVDTSTGTSGKPTKWIRGYREMENVKYWIGIASKAAVGKRPYIFCNMFALGPWATGMTSAYALTGKQLVLSIGPNFEMLYDALRDFGTEPRYVIAGYPPHMKKLVENAPFDLSKFDITMVVGGEAMSENVYKTIIDAGIKAVFSSYGASDLRINIAQSTQFEQELQKICKDDAEFKKALLGTLEGTPTFFHYNPLLDYIEETIDGRLLFTDLDESRVSPRVRYDLGDKGKILPISFVRKLLTQYGYSLTPETNLPIICLYGRGDDALTFNGCNIMYDDLEYALKKLPILFQHVNRYAYNKFENKNLDQELELWIELKKGETLEELGLSSEIIGRKLIAALGEVNQDFKFQVDAIQNNPDSRLPMPRVRIFEYGKSPMVEQGPHHKNKYVYSIPVYK